MTIVGQKPPAEGRLNLGAPRPMRATPGWPPVAIPGRPGWWRHCINGQQVDLPSREASDQGRGDGQ